MSWRTVVITKTSKLDYSLGYMVMRDVENTVKIHISEISVLIIDSTSVSLTSYLLNELVKAKVKVIFSDEKHNPGAELTPYCGSHDSSLKLKCQIGWDEYAKKYIWTRIVSEKIRNQAAVLERFGIEGSGMMSEYIREIELGDASNREGHAAKVYFNRLFGKEFSRNKDCPINAALNYGYSLILSVINREVVCSGYVTQLGIFHDNMFNKYNLSCDLIEPLRPLVDVFAKENITTEFGSKEKRELLGLFEKEVTVDERKTTLLNGIKLYCKSVFGAIEAIDDSLICFVDYEL